MKSLISLLFVLLIFSGIHAQFSPSIVSPYSQNSNVEKSRGEDYDPYQPFFFPFRGYQELQQIYDSDNFSTAKITNFSLPVDSGPTGSNSMYVEIASIIPNNSALRISLGSQLVQSDITDSTDTENYRSMAINKLVNGGGNVVLGFSRLLAYKEFYNGGFFYMNPSVSTYFDVPSLNNTNWADRMGTQFRMDYELRLFGAGTERQAGNLVRAGMKGYFIGNLFGFKYDKSETNVFNKFSTDNYAGVSGGAYISIALFELDYYYNVGFTSDIFKGHNSTLNLSIIPVKF